METLPLSPIGVLHFYLNKIKINFLLNLSQNVVFGDSLPEVDRMIEKLWLKSRLMTHHGKASYLLSLPHLYIQLKTLARMIWAATRKEMTMKLLKTRS